MKRFLIHAIISMGVASSAIATPIVSYVQINPPNGKQAGGYNLQTSTITRLCFDDATCQTTAATGGGGGSTNGNITAANQYSVGYYSGVSTNTIAGIPPGTAGQVFTTQGASSPPNWTSPVLLNSTQSWTAQQTFKNSVIISSSLVFTNGNGVILGNASSITVTAPLLISNSATLVGSLYVSGSGNGAGSAGDILQSAGPGGTPIWQPATQSSLLSSTNTWTASQVFSSSLTANGRVTLSSQVYLSNGLGPAGYLFAANAAGVGTWLAPGTLPYILNSATFQANSVFNTSSGTVGGQFNVSTGNDLNNTTIGSVAANGLSSTGVLVVNSSGTNTSTGVSGSANGAPSLNIGVSGNATGNGGAVNYAGYFHAATGSQNYALYTDAGIEHFGDLSPSLSVCTDGSSNLTTSGCASGGGGGSSSLQVTQSGVQITSPTASQNFFGNDFQLQGVGSTATVALNPNTTDFIHLSSTLQTGATFYVSSGTIKDANISNSLTVLSTTSVNALTIYSPPLPINGGFGPQVVPVVIDALAGTSGASSGFQIIVSSESRAIRHSYAYMSFVPPVSNAFGNFNINLSTGSAGVYQFTNQSLLMPDNTPISFNNNSGSGDLTFFDPLSNGMVIHSVGSTGVAANVVSFSTASTGVAILSISTQGAVNIAGVGGLGVSYGVTATTGAFSSGLTVSGQNVCQANGTNCPASGGSGSSSLQITQSGVQITSPTSSVNAFGNDFQLQANGSTATWALNAGTSNYYSPLNPSGAAVTSITPGTAITLSSITAHSILLSDRTHFGVVSDLSLSGDKTALSYSVWVKFAAGTQGLQIMGNNESVAGHGGGSLLMNSLHEPEMMVENISLQPAWSPPAAADGVFGTIGQAQTWVGDGNWHSIVGTYDSSVLRSSITAVVDSTHLTVTTSTGMNPGDRIYFTTITATITSIPDTTHLIVDNTTNLTTGRFVCRGVNMYFDGVLQRVFTDYEYTIVGSAINSSIKFAIGDAQQNYKTVLGNYAYPAVYSRILSPNEVNTIYTKHIMPYGADAMWIFGEGTGTTAQDSTGNGHVLTFNTVDSWSSDIPFISSGNIVVNVSTGNFIANQSSLQSGATFYISSGTISGQLTASTYQGGNLSTCGDSTHALSWASGSFGCQSITGSGGSSASSITVVGVTGSLLTANATNFIYTNGTGFLFTVSTPTGNQNSVSVTGSIDAAVVPRLAVANTWTNQQLWSSPLPSTFTYQVNVGSITGSGLSTCGDSSHALAYTASTGQFSCQSITGSGGGASLSSTNTWTAQQIFTASSTFNGGVYISSTVLLGGSPGTNGQYLTSAGNGSVPTWTTASGGGDMVLASTQTSTGSKTFKNGSDSSAGPVIITSSGTGNVLQVNASGAFGTSDGASGGSLFSCNEVQSQGPCVQIFSNQALQSALTSPLYLVQNNTAADNPNIYVVAKGTSPQNGLRLDGADYSTLALIDTLRSASSKNGKFQISSHNNELRGERRNSANNAFESAWVVDSSTGPGIMFVGTDYSRPVSTMDIAGATSIGVGVAGITAAPLNGLLVQGNILNQALSASLPVQTDGSKNLISSAIDISGSQATGVLAAGRFPALTGDVTTSAGSLATTAAARQNNITTLAASSTTVAGIAGLVVNQGILASTMTLINASSANTLLISTSATGVALLSVPSAPAVSPTDFLLTVSSTSGTMGFGVQNSGHIISSGTTPSMGTCGSSPAVIGTDTSGTITVGGGVVTSCTLNFVTPFSNTPVCVCSDNSTTVACSNGTVNTTSYTINTSATLGGGVLTYICIGNKG